MVKKGLLLGLISCFFLLAFATATFALNGPHQGPGFLADTDACAGCHRAHTGTAIKLLKNGTTGYTFCTACHNGLGANTNVMQGKFEGTVTSWGTDNNGDAGMGLNGGGFEAAVAYTGRQSRSGVPVNLSGDLQRHDVTGGDNVTKGAWGGGYTGPSQDITNFTCSSCHDPHGTRNEDFGVGQTIKDGSERYRILKGVSYSKVNGKATGVIKSHEMKAAPAGFGKHDYTKDAYETGLSNFCTACHTQYKTAQGTIDQFGNEDTTGTYDAGDDQGAQIRYRHRITGLTNGDLDGIRGTGTSVWGNLNNSTKLPLEQISYTPEIKQADYISCSTCHQSHGTSASMSLNANVKPANSSTLLRLNNRGVCQACHSK